MEAGVLVCDVQLAFKGDLHGSTAQQRQAH
jgi:hypothetical protein